MLQWRSTVKSNACGPKNARLAKNYRLVHDVLREQARGSHLCAADVFALARRRQPKIGVTTVYRALGRLRSMGLVAEIFLPGTDTAYYETAGAPHAHFRCAICGSVEDIRYAVPESFLAEVADLHDVEVSEVLVSLTGHCARCKGSGA